MTDNTDTASVQVKKKSLSDANFRFSPKGCLAASYDRQKTRGYQFEHLSPTYTRHEFYQRFLNDETYLRLYTEWKESGYQKRLRPSVDRIDPRKGYSMDNIQMVTYELNRRKGFTENATTAVEVYDLEGNKLAEYESMTEASKATGCRLGNIHHICTGKRKSIHGLVFKYRGDKFAFYHHREGSPVNPRDLTLAEINLQKSIKENQTLRDKLTEQDSLLRRLRAEVEAARREQDEAQAANARYADCVAGMVLDAEVKAKKVQGIFEVIQRAAEWMSLSDLQRLTDQIGEVMERD